MAARALHCHLPELKSAVGKRRSSPRTPVARLRPQIENNLSNNKKKKIVLQPRLATLRSYGSDGGVTEQVSVSPFVDKLFDYIDTTKKSHDFEIVSGRLAMIVFAATVTTEMLTGSSIFQKLDTQGIDEATAMTDKSESAPTAHNLPPPETEDLAWTLVQKRKRKTKQAQKGKTQTITKQDTPACSTSGAAKDKTSSIGQRAKEGQSFIQKGTLAEATSPHGKLLHPSSGTLQTCITDAKELALNMEACKDPIATLDSTLAGTGIGAGQPLTSDVDYTNSAGSHVLDYTVGIINHHQGTSQGDGALGIISANYGLPPMTIFRRTRDMKISSPAASQKNRSIINSPRSASRRSPSFLLPRVCCLPIRDGLHPPTL